MRFDQASKVPNENVRRTMRNEIPSIMIANTSNSIRYSIATKQDPRENVPRMISPHGELEGLGALFASVGVIYNHAGDSLEGRLRRACLGQSELGQAPPFPSC